MKDVIIIRYNNVFIKHCSLVIILWQGVIHTMISLNLCTEQKTNDNLNIYIYIHELHTTRNKLIYISNRKSNIIIISTYNITITKIDNHKKISNNIPQLLDWKLRSITINCFPGSIRTLKRGGGGRCDLRLTMTLF